MCVCVCLGICKWYQMIVFPNTSKLHGRCMIRTLSTWICTVARRRARRIHLSAVTDHGLDNIPRRHKATRPWQVTRSLRHFPLFQESKGLQWSATLSIWLTVLDMGRFSQIMVAVSLPLHDALLRLQATRESQDDLGWPPSRELGFQMSPLSAFCSKFSKTDLVKTQFSHKTYQNKGGWISDPASTLAQAE